MCSNSGDKAGEGGLPGRKQLATLALLTMSFMVGEVAHFLPTVTSKAMANSIGFGDMRCYTNATMAAEPSLVCSGFESKTE